MFFSPPRKSETCFSRKGTPLSEYDSFEMAQAGADYENSKNSDVHFVPYQCDQCGKFHLKPEEFYVRKLKTHCACTDSCGNYKDAYPTEEQAIKMVGIRKKDGVQLSVYRCPEGNGWHLTSHAWR